MCGFSLITTFTRPLKGKIRIGGEEQAAVFHEFFQGRSEAVGYIASQIKHLERLPIPTLENILF
jgi:hypothetical protein